MSKCQHVFAFELEYVINSFPIFFIRLYIYFLQIVLILWFQFQMVSILISVFILVSKSMFQLMSVSILLSIVVLVTVFVIVFVFIISLQKGHQKVLFIHSIVLSCYLCCVVYLFPGVEDKCVYHIDHCLTQMWPIIVHFHELFFCHEKLVLFAMSFECPIQYQTASECLQLHSVTFTEQHVYQIFVQCSRHFLIINSSYYIFLLKQTILIRYSERYEIVIDMGIFYVLA